MSVQEENATGGRGTAFRQLMAEHRERQKELAAINQTTALVKEGKSIPETLRQISMLLPEAWQYPEYTVARIRLGKHDYVTPGFHPSAWSQRQNI
ncbi:MAG TPA: hypothetical protein P5248_09130, partial [Bacteroidales bacterium]|nr:hypothetical protein [Bacteroidales bacterium]